MRNRGSFGNKGRDEHCLKQENRKTILARRKLQAFLSGSAVNNLQTRRCGFNPRVGKVPWRKEMATHSNILAWKTPIQGVANELGMTGQLNHSNDGRQVPATGSPVLPGGRACEQWTVVPAHLRG